MEILHEIPVERWPELQRKLKRRWPQNMAGYYALKLNITYQTIRDMFQFKVFCPYGDIDNGLVFISTYGVGDNMQNGGEQLVNIFPTSNVTDKLEDAIKTTKLIKWKQNVAFYFVPTNLIYILKNIDQLENHEINTYHLSLYYKESTTEKFELRLPSDTYVASIKSEHIQKVNDLWAHKFVGSDKLFANLASNALGFGLYSIMDDQLLAWIFIGEYGYLCHLYCEEKQRNKGYGNYLVKYMTNELLSRGDDAFCFIVQGNLKSMSLFKKLDFQYGGDCIYYKMKYKL